MAMSMGREGCSANNNIGQEPLHWNKKNLESEERREQIRALLGGLLSCCSYPNVILAVACFLVLVQ